MKTSAFLAAIAVALMVSGCVTTEQETAGAAAATDPVKTAAKPVAKVTPKARTQIRTKFIDI